MYLPFDTDTEPSKFKECARHPKVEEEGFVLYYTDQCPFTCYWVPRVVEVAKEHNILKGNSCYKQKSCTERSGTGDNVCAIQRWKVLTQGIQSDEKISGSCRPGI